MFDIEKKHIPLLVFNSSIILIFGYKFFLESNYEFLLYLGAVILFSLIIIYSNKYVKYSFPLLSLLSLGILVHLAGGGISYNGVILYETIIFPISETYSLIRYDQLAHGFGFFTATILAYEIIRYKLRELRLNFGMMVVLAMAGCGFGTLNEIVEFIASQSIKETGVGGYINTSVDLIVNMIGSVLGVIFIKIFLDKNPH